MTRRAILVCAILLMVLIGAAFIWRDDILRTGLDPKEPFQVYAPPPAPDYAQPSSWLKRPKDRRAESALPVDVFFVHPTTYNGGPHWNGPIADKASAAQAAQIMLPNYAGPFREVGRVFAPRYRQASLYAQLTRRDDAREARRFAYGDVARAFNHYLAHDNGGRPFILVGVEQGGFIADRLLRDVVGRDPALIDRLAAAYLVRTVVAAEDYGPRAVVPGCSRRAQARCVVAFATAPETGGERARDILDRALLWGKGADLQPLGNREALCVNPLTGDQGTGRADRTLNHGAVNASRLAWEVRPARLAGQVSAACVDGVLRVSRPRSGSLRPHGPWADRLKAPPYNLFFADLEVDAKQRTAVLLGRDAFPVGLPPITDSIPVRGSPIHRID